MVDFKDTYLAPYRLEKDARPITGAHFILPICFTLDRYQKFLGALTQGGWDMYQVGIGDHNIDTLRAMAYINMPYAAAQNCNVAVDSPPPETQAPPPPVTVADDIPFRFEGGAWIIDLECEDDMPIIINYGCCGGTGAGCSCGSNGSGKQYDDPNIVTGGGFGASGGWTNDGGTGAGAGTRTSNCDIAYGLMSYVLSQAVEWVRAFDGATDLLDSFVDAGWDAAGAVPLVGNTIEGTGGGFADWLQAILDIGAEAYENMLLDSDFILQAQVSWIKAHGQDTYKSTITRQDLLETIQYLPRVQSFNILANAVVVLPRTFFAGFYRIVNMEKINARMQLARGTAPDGFCNYAYNEAGFAPPATGTPGSVPPPVPFVESGGYRLYTLADQVAAPELTQVTITAPAIANLIGVINLVERTAGGGPGTAGRGYRVTVETPDGTDTHFFDYQQAESTNGQYAYHFLGATATIDDIIAANFPDYNAEFSGVIGAANTTKKEATVDAPVTLPAEATVTIDNKTNELGLIITSYALATTS